MSESSNAEFAEFAAYALDAFQEQFDDRTEPGHRSDPDRAAELVSDLLTDLMHYAELHWIDFDRCLDTGRLAFAGERVEEGKFVVGSLVQFTGQAAKDAERASLPFRGVVTGMLTPRGGPARYHVRCPGDTRSHRFTGSDLQPAPPFPPNLTYQGLIADPLDAEKALLDATARIGAADSREITPRHDDVQDHHVLLAALSAWSGLGEDQLTKILYPKVVHELHRLEDRLDPWKDVEPGITPGTSSDPVRLAAQDFPSTLNGGVTRDPTQPDSRPTSANRPTRGPGR